MGSLFSVGGLATGLDTNQIIAKLLGLERRPIDRLEARVAAVQATKTSIGTIETKLAALRTAARSLDTVAGVLAASATSSDETVLAAAAGTGASRGSATITVTQLARGSVAGATIGVASVSSTIASGSGSLRFQVGSADVQSVPINAATTLQDLVNAINDLDAGVTALAVNLGTADSPDYRLAMTSRTTGSATTITVVQDDSALALQTTQAGADAQFAVAGFSGTFARATNSFSDVLPGVTLSLKTTGTSTVTVSDDPDKIVGQVKDLVTAFNDLATFVAGETKVNQHEQGAAVQLGSLATDQTVRRLLGRLHETFSQTVDGATTRYVNLSGVGLSTKQDGTIALDETKLRAALAADPDALAKLFAGNGIGAGVANDLATLADEVTRAGGLLDTRTTALDDEIRSLEDQIDVAERRVTAVEAYLRAQFAALEKLVSGLQSQSGFLSQALGR